MAFQNTRFHNHLRKRTPNASCSTGGFYKNPVNGQQVNSASPLNITWDTTCLTSSAVDIYLYAPGTNKSRLHVWETVNYLLGSYEATLNPEWWNATSSIQLQLGIVASGTPPFTSTLPAGPLFTATYTTAVAGAIAGSSTPDSAITQVDNFSATKKALAPGKTAAAVIMTLLLVGLLIASYFKLSRAKGKAERKRWTEAIDKRMSTISTDWKSMSAAGASAAIRNSIAVPGTDTSSRNSSFSFGAIRPPSMATVDGGQAGIGARTLFMRDNTNLDEEKPAVSQLRPPRVPAFGERVSRVSFAADTRPSSESRRTIASRAFHTSFVPPVPHHHNGIETESTGSMSPTQTEGPLTLTSEDIRARIAGQEHTARPSMDELMPALSLMRHGGDGIAENSEFLFKPPPSPSPSPTLPAPTHAKSPVGMMPMEPVPANVMSPDEMLRAYAERRQTLKPVNAISYPAPVANYNGNGMRTLYSPASPTNAVSMMSIGTAMDRQSVAQTIESRYSGDEDAYVGTAE